MSVEKACLISSEDGQVPPAYSPPEAVVKQPGVTPVLGGVRTMPTDPSLNTVYLSIFAMLFCCWPCGLVGLIYGIQAMQEYYRGQYDISAGTEKRARRWMIASIVTGIVFTVSVISVVIISQVVIYSVVFTETRKS